MDDPDLRTAYHDLRRRVVDLVTSAPPDDLERLTSAAPEWRVRDVVAHLAGVTADIVNGNLDGDARSQLLVIGFFGPRSSPLHE